MNIVNEHGRLLESGSLFVLEEDGRLAAGF
jgi:hypothetical protein